MAKTFLFKPTLKLLPGITLVFTIQVKRIVLRDKKGLIINKPWKARIIEAAYEPAGKRWPRLHELHNHLNALKGYAHTADTEDQVLKDLKQVILGWLIYFCEAYDSEQHARDRTKRRKQRSTHRPQPDPDQGSTIRKIKQLVALSQSTTYPAEAENARLRAAEIALKLVLSM